MCNRMKTLLLFLLLGVALRSDALAGATGERDEDWTIEVAGKTFGLAGDSSVTHICYGKGFFDVHLPFFGAVGLTALLPIVCVGIVYFLHRRGKRNAT